MKHLFILAFFLIAAPAFSQKSIATVLKKLNKETVPYIKVDAIDPKVNYTFLDARAIKEYEVSHLEKSVFVDFDTFDRTNLSALLPDKNSVIVVYCSVGVRSEIIGEKLLKLGYKKVYNLYGGIFEWKNKGRKVVNMQGIATDSVHTYNSEWSQYLQKGTKVYED
ncbi:rhodanese-like domain-containing protein [Flavobacterium sp. SM2513]|uniref:rhodanese-like domain-containing protein n=1 Tax=Flavobacterium sp. SM2513 TaxID=3424766 RepID=UPI003D7F69E9